MEFKVGDRVLLKVSPTKGITRFGIVDKVSPGYIRPYPITQRVGEVTYLLGLPPELPRVHNVFHVSQLRKYTQDPSHVIKLDPTHL